MNHGCMYALAVHRHYMYMYNVLIVITVLTVLVYSGVIST